MIRHPLHRHTIGTATDLQAPDHQTIHPHGAIAVVSKGPNGHRLAVAGQGNGRARLISHRLAVNVGAPLLPSTTIPAIYPHMARVCAIAVISNGPNGYRLAVAGQGYRITRSISRRLAVDVRADLCSLSTHRIKHGDCGCSNSTVVDAVVDLVGEGVRTDELIIRLVDQCLASDGTCGNRGIGVGRV